SGTGIRTSGVSMAKSWRRGSRWRRWWRCTPMRRWPTTWRAASLSIRVRLACHTDSMAAAPMSREEVLSIKTLQVSRHPLVKDKITRLREASRSPETFRILVGQLTTLLLYEALADLPVAPHSVQTPLAECQGS